MFKTLLAGLTATALALSAPAAQANSHQTGFDHEEVATAIFGLVVLGALAKALSSNRDDDRATIADRDGYAPPVVRDDPRRIAPDRGGLRGADGGRWFDDRGGLRGDSNPTWFDTDRRGRALGHERGRGRGHEIGRGRGHDRHRDDVVADTRAVPASCLRAVDTRFGTQHLFGRACLQDRYAGFSRLPDRCAVQVYTTSDRLRRGYDPLCLRSEGYIADNRR